MDREAVVMLCKELLKQSDDIVAVVRAGKNTAVCFLFECDAVGDKSFADFFGAKALDRWQQK